MDKQLTYIIIAFLAGISIGWLNPIEGPLDWTYDDYASHQAIKSPYRVSPPIKEENTFIVDPWDEEDIVKDYEDNLLKGKVNLYKEE